MSFTYFEADTHVSSYNKFRPSPPAKLIDDIVSFAKRKISDPKTVVDIGCGSGQSTEILGDYFQNVTGLDPSLPIVLEARKKSSHQNVTYSQSAAEKLCIPGESVDVLTVGMAVHWFDLKKFYAEADRVLRKDGVLALYGYCLPCPIYDNKDEKLKQVIEKFYGTELGDYCLSESKMVYLNNYRSPEFNEIPFIEGGIMQRHEGYVTETEAYLSDITGYISSWSAFQNYAKQKGDENGKKLLMKFEQEFLEAMGQSPSAGDEPVKMKVQFKYFLLLGRKN